MTSRSPRSDLATPAAAGVSPHGPPRAWFAVQTRSRHEKVVANGLARAGLHAYLPLYSQVRRYGYRRQVVELPVFPGYLFVHCADAERERAYSARGIVRLVGCSGGPVPVPEREIRAIRDALARDVPFVLFAGLEPGRPVRVVRGPLRGLEGRMVSRQGRHRLLISVELLGRGIAAEVDVSDVEPI